MPIIQQTTPLPGFPRRVGSGTGCLGIVWADLRAFSVIAGVSLCVGLLVNGLQQQPLPLVYQSKTQRMAAEVARLDSVLPPGLPGKPGHPPREIGLEEFQAMVFARKGVVIDARPSSFYGEGHVPGAINLSRENFGADYQRLRPQLELRKPDLTVVYCSGADCQDSGLVADALEKLGYAQLLVYKEGWEEWSQSGLPQEK